MKRFCLGLLCLGVVLITGCAQTSLTITRGSHYSDFEDANLQCYGTTNHIRLRDGSIIATKQLALGRDSAMWILPDGRRQQVRLWDIQRIDNVNHRRGARSGAFAGLLAGLGGGIAISSQISTHGTLGTVAVTAVSSAASLVGGIVGVTIGKAIGYPTVITFDSTVTVPSDTMRPPTHNAAGWAMPESSDSTHRR